MKKNKEYLYLQISDDEYELPIAVAGSITELAVKTGVSQAKISSALYHAEKEGCKTVYVRIEVDE